MARKKKTKSQLSKSGTATQASQTMGVSTDEQVVSQVANRSEENDERLFCWVIDQVAGYERLTDRESQMMVIRFRDKPNQNTLDLLKRANFEFQAEYLGLKEVWTRKDDFEGREQVKAIEAAVRGLGVGLQ
jgi:hypothetical protein